MSEPGRDVLALHCALASGATWRGVAGHLPNARLICPDLPGHGNAPGWDVGRDFQDQALELALAAMPEGPVDILGHSFGGTLALRLAVEHPDRVRSLALVEPVMFAAADADARSAHAKEMAPFAEAMERGDREAAAAAFHAFWGTGQWAALPGAARDAIAARIHLIPASEPAILRDVHDVLPRLPGDLPVLIVTRRAPPDIVGAIVRGLRDRLAQARTLRIGEDHMIPITAAGDLAEALADFWGG